MSATPPSEAVLRTLVVCDLVDSTRLVERLGDVRAAQVTARHDHLSRDLLRLHEGQEIDKTDGFLLLFERPIRAVLFALAYHRTLAQLATEEGLELRSRVGVHLGEVHLWQNSPGHVAQGAKPIEVEGLAKPMAARLMTLAEPGQTLLTRGAFDLARRGAVGEGQITDDLHWLAHGEYLFQGLDESVEVFEVGEEGEAPLVAPQGSPKVRRAQHGDTVLGWRPAAGLKIPQRSNWVLESKAGAGGAGEVWLASHEKTHERRIFKFCLDVANLRLLQREVALFRLLKEELGDRDDITRILDWSFDEPPYFIESEYTAGGNLAEWIEQQGGVDAVPLATRLELVAQIADALAAAHSVGVLHKDIKPANVLVRQEAGGEPKARLTDFGIGLVTDRERLRDAGITLVELSEGVAGSGYEGTRLYMAPELMEGKRATVQADVYALGVVLYQMVVGDLSRALASGWERGVDDPLLREDIARAVDGDPSQRLGNALRIAQRLRSLAPRRAQRSAEERSREVARRHRLWWRWGAAAALVLALFAADRTYQAHRVAREADRANHEATTAREIAVFLEELFAVSDPDQSFGDRITAREILDRGAARIRSELAGQPEVQAPLMNTMGNAYRSLGLYDSAAPLLEGALALRRQLWDEEHPDVATSLHDLARNLHSQGHLDRAEALHAEALEMRRRLHGPQSLEVAESLFGLAQTESTQNRYALAEQHHREALAIREERLGEGPEVVASLVYLAASIARQDRHDEAEAIHRRALEMADRTLGESHPVVSESHYNLAFVLWRKGLYADAEAELRQALRLDRKRLGDERHPLVGSGLTSLALVVAEQGRLDEALPLFEQAVEIYRERLGSEHPWVAQGLYNLARFHLDRMADADTALVEIEEALTIRRQLFGPEHPSVVEGEILRAACLGKLGRASEAEAELTRLRAKTARDSGRPMIHRDALRRSLELAEANGDGDLVHELQAELDALPDLR